MKKLFVGNVDVLILLDLVEHEIDYCEGEKRTDENFKTYYKRLLSIKENLEKNL